MKNYPRVLIFGHSFDNSTGMGITLTNLFKNWPKENIAIWAGGINEDLCEEIRPCAIYIGAKSKVIHGKVSRSKIKTRFRNFLRKYYHKTGIGELLSKKELPIDYVDKARQFNPEILFCALGNYSAMKECESALNSLPDAKLVLYIVDDWVNTIINNRYFSSLWRRLYNKKYRYLLDKSRGLLSICQFMSDEYNRIYDKSFVPFHNPVDVETWNGINVPYKYPDNVISILYVGKINKDTAPCLMDMSKVVDNLNKAGGNYVFDIYSPNYYENSFLFKNNKYTHLLPPISHNNIPFVMKSYRSLFLPLGFSKQSREYVRLSMPTKLTEYLASQRPIILYCPQEIALSKYLSDKDCSIICNERSISGLEDAVKRLYSRNDYERLVANSLNLAQEHDVTIVREKFRATLCGFLK